MTRRTENRIWRGLFLATLVGVCIAATSRTANPQAVQYLQRDGGPDLLLTTDGSVWEWKRIDRAMGADTNAWKRILDGSRGENWITR